MNKDDKRITFIDLFAGAGGLSEGFYQAGFTPVAHVEINQQACLTLKTRSAFHYCNRNNHKDLYLEYYKGCITRNEFYSQIPFEKIEPVIKEDISEENFENILNQIEQAKQKADINTIDVIIGGPPCQAFSIRGRKINEPKKQNDKRIYYYKLYARFLRTIKPKIFLFENVPGLVNFEQGDIFDDLRKELNAAGYELDYKILNAADFGVLQERKRVIIIGWKKELEFTYPSFNVIKYDAIVNDLLYDIPATPPGITNPPLKYRKQSNKYLNITEIRNGLPVISQHITRPHNKNDLEIYRRVIDKWNSKEERLKYNQLPEKLRTHKDIEGYLDRFKVVVGDRPYSHTLIAHIAKDGHHYIHPDINQCRSISVREAARIQSFSDDFIFEESRTSAFTQIGNAVPPLMAKQIASLIKIIFLE